tara:strand:+ start:1061 stop:1270 length:210 start_codon:yes stop_codon:yes gene_type:complete
MKLENQSGDSCEIGFAKPSSWYDWSGYRIYKVIRRINNKPVEFINAFYHSDSDEVSGFEKYKENKYFYI